MAKHIPLTPEPEVATTASSPAQIGEPVLPVTDQRKTTRGLNPELQAMAKIDRILSELTLTAQGRVIDWLSARAAEVVVSVAKRNFSGCSGGPAGAGGSAFGG